MFPLLLVLLRSEPHCSADIPGSLLALPPDPPSPHRSLTATPELSVIIFSSPNSLPSHIFQREATEVSARCQAAKNLPQDHGCDYPDQQHPALSPSDTSTFFQKDLLASKCPHTSTSQRLDTVLAYIISQPLSLFIFFAQFVLASVENIQDILLKRV